MSQAPAASDAPSLPIQAFTDGFSALFQTTTTELLSSRRALTRSKTQSELRVFMEDLDRMTALEAQRVSALDANIASLREMLARMTRAVQTLIGE